MLKRYFVFPFFSLTMAVLFALLGTGSAYAQNVFYVDQGDDATLTSYLGPGSPRCSTIVITSLNSLWSTPPAPFTASYTLGPDDSGKKIVAAPGETAVFSPTGGGPAFTIAGAANVILENLIITGNPTGPGVLVQPLPTGVGSVVKIINCQIFCNLNGVQIQSNSTAEIEGSRILNNSGFGVHLESLIPGAPGASATIENTQVRNNRIGVMLRGTRGRVKIWRSMIDKNSADGVFVSRQNSAVLNNNDISFNGGNGVIFEEGAQGSVSFNTIAYNTMAGVSSFPPVKVNPGHNTLEGNTPNFTGQPFMPPNQF